jgi:hypothetical protein
LIGAKVVRALVLTAAFAGALTPVRCFGEDGNQLPPKGNNGAVPRWEKLAEFRERLELAEL